MSKKSVYRFTDEEKKITRVSVILLSIIVIAALALLILYVSSIVSKTYSSYYFELEYESMQEDDSQMLSVVVTNKVKDEGADGVTLGIKSVNPLSGIVEIRLELIDFMDTLMVEQSHECLIELSSSSLVKDVIIVDYR